jgi:OOP family OmpA-OmpF porin
MKHLFTILFTVVALFSNAQFIKKLSLDLNVGGRFGGAVSDSIYGGEKAKVSQGIHVNGGVRYQLSKLISLRGGISYDGFKTTWGTLPDDKSELISGSLEAIVNLKSFQYSDFGLAFHGGFGLSTLSNSKFKEGKEFSDPAIKGNDDMINIVLGLTPQFKLNDKISINLDLSTKLLLKTSLYVNAGQDSRVNDKMGNIFNVAVGATYKF